MKSILDKIQSGKQNLRHIYINKHIYHGEIITKAVQFSSVAQSCPTLCDPMNRSTPGLPVHHQLPEFTQTHIHRVSDAIQKGVSSAWKSDKEGRQPEVSNSKNPVSFRAGGTKAENSVIWAWGQHHLGRNWCSEAKGGAIHQGLEPQREETLWSRVPQREREEILWLLSPNPQSPTSASHWPNLTGSLSERGPGKCSL